MPIYEYSCRNCDESFEKLCPSSVNDGDVECPGCGKKEAKRKLSLFSCCRSSGAGVEGASAPARPFT